MKNYLFSEIGWSNNFVVMASSKFKAQYALAEFLRKKKYHGQNNQIIQNTRDIAINFEVKEFDKEKVIQI